MSKTNGVHRPATETELPIASIKPSPLNPRKHFDEAELADLARTIATYGVLQPILVWQPKSGGAYELLAGERRLRAATLAKLKTIPAKILHVNAQQAREIRLIENVQRKDLTVVEFAADCAALVADHGYTSETLAERIGKSAATVRSLVKIGRQLPGIARDALDAGRIVTSTAALIARVPGEAARDEAARFVLAGWTHGWDPKFGVAPPTAAEAKAAEVKNKHALGVVQTKELIATRYMRELKQAPFSRENTGLLPDAGSCTQCSKCTGNAPDDYPDSRADICTDPACYDAKAEAHGQALLRKHQDAGRIVLPAHTTATLFDHYNGGRLSHQAKAEYVDLADTCATVPGNTGWKKLVGAELDAEIVVAIDPKGAVHELVPKARAMAVLKRAHPECEQNGNSRPQSNLEKENARRQRACKAAAREANGLVAAAVQREAALTLGVQSTRMTDVLRTLARQMAETVWSDACRVVMLRRGRNKGVAGDARDAVRDIAGQCNGAELLGLIGELVAARVSLGWSPHSREQPAETKFWATFGVRPEQLKKEAEAAAKDKANGEGRKGKAKAAPKASAPTAAADWRSQGVGLVHELEPADVRLVMKLGIRTLGQLADRLAARDTCGLAKPTLQLLRHRIATEKAAGVQFTVPEQREANAEMEAAHA